MHRLLPIKLLPTIGVKAIKEVVYASISDYCGFGDLECCCCFKKVFPKQQTRPFSTIRFCEKQGWATLAKWLKPKMTFGCAGGCDCSSEDKPTNTVQEIKPVKWQ